MWEVSLQSHSHDNSVKYIHTEFEIQDGFKLVRILCLQCSFSLFFCKMKKKKPTQNKPNRATLPVCVIGETCSWISQNSGLRVKLMDWKQFKNETLTNKSEALPKNCLGKPEHQKSLGINQHYSKLPPLTKPHRSLMPYCNQDNLSIKEKNSEISWLHWEL